ncbi:bifunctional DNA primase/polymerase [Amycolatopsis thermoflava]
MPAPPRPRLMTAALAAVARGWPVFPLAPRAKNPAFGKVDWNTLATTDRDTITRVWTQAPYNIGIATGAAGLLVIDLDDGHGQPPPPPWTTARHGRDVLAALAHAAGQPYPGDTYTVTTPTGGEHLYFQAPAGVRVRTTTGALGWRIDTRGHRGYIVAAGSIRRDGRYRVTRRAPVQPLPAWLIHALTPPAPAVPRGGGARQHHAAYRQAALDGETRKVADALDGQRRITLLRAASALASIPDLDTPTITAALTAAAHTCRTRTSGRFSDREIARTIRDGIAFGRTHPRTP